MSNLPLIERIIDLPWFWMGLGTLIGILFPVGLNFFSSPKIKLSLEIFDVRNDLLAEAMTLNVGIIADRVLNQKSLSFDEFGHYALIVTFAVVMIFVTLVVRREMLHRTKVELWRMAFPSILAAATLFGCIYFLATTNLL